MCKTIFPIYNVIMAHKVLYRSLSGAAYVVENTLFFAQNSWVGF